MAMKDVNTCKGRAQEQDQREQGHSCQTARHDWQIDMIGVNHRLAEQTWVAVIPDTRFWYCLSLSPFVCRLL